MKGMLFDGAVPTFLGSFSDNLIQFKGSFYTSDTWGFISPIYSWMEFDLKSKPKQIRLEFWMDYYNTMISKVFLEMITIFNKYSRDTNSDLNILWYCLESDIDMIEAGEEYKKESPKSFDIKILDDKQWERMNK